MILLQLLLLFPVTQLIGCADSAYHLHFYLIKEIQPKGFGSSEALSGDTDLSFVCHTFFLSVSMSEAQFPPLPSFIGQRYKQNEKFLSLCAHAHVCGFWGDGMGGGRV